MEQKHAIKIILSLVLCLTFVFCMNMVSSSKAASEEAGETVMPETSSAPDETDNPEEPSVSEEPTATPTLVPTPAPTLKIDVSKVKLNKTKTVIMQKKKTTLSLAGLPQETPVPGRISPQIPSVTWQSQNPAIATVTNGVVKGVKKGTTVVEARVGGAVFRCTITVVSKMVKKDFGKFNGENFVAFCQRKGYNYGYAWVGQWKGRSKKKSTYRGIKIGASTSKVKKKYGEFTLKKCTKKDPFTKTKGLKKSKVKKYTDMKYGKYRIRFYFDKKNKVAAIIYSCNLGKIKKRALKKYM